MKFFKVCCCVFGNGESDLAVCGNEIDVFVCRFVLVKNVYRDISCLVVGLGELQRAGAVHNARHRVLAVICATGIVAVHSRTSLDVRWSSITFGWGMDHHDTTHGPDNGGAQNLSVYDALDGAFVPWQGDGVGCSESASRDVDLRLEGIVPRLLDSNGPRAGLERTCRYRRAAGEMVDSSEVGLVAVGEGDGGVNQRACIVFDTDVECDCRCLVDDVADRCRCGRGCGEFQRCGLEGGGLIAVEVESHVVGICGRWDREVAVGVSQDVVVGLASANWGGDDFDACQDRVRGIGTGRPSSSLECAFERSPFLEIDSGECDVLACAYFRRG